MELGYPVVVKGDLFSRFFVVVVIVCSFYAILNYVIWACALPWFDKVNQMMQLWFESTESFEFREGKKTKLGYRWAGNSVLSWCHYIIRSSHFVTVKWTLMVMLLHFRVFQLIVWPMVSHGFLKVTLFNKHQNLGRFQPFYLSSSVSSFHEFSIFFKQTSENTREGTINSFN